MALREELEQNGQDDIHVCTVMPVSHDTPFFEHAANYTGKPVHPIPPVYDPQNVVDVIYELALEPEDEVVVGPSGKIGSLGERFAPKRTEKRMAKQAHKAQMKQSKRARDKSGSVFTPEETGTGVYGGWNESNGKLGKILGIAVPLGMGAAYFALRRTRSRQDENRRAA